MATGRVRLGANETNAESDFWTHNFTSAQEGDRIERRQSVNTALFLLLTQKHLQPLGQTHREYLCP